MMTLCHRFHPSPGRHRSWYRTAGGRLDQARLVKFLTRLYAGGDVYRADELAAHADRRDDGEGGWSRSAEEADVVQLDEAAIERALPLVSAGLEKYCRIQAALPATDVAATSVFRPDSMASTGCGGGISLGDDSGFAADTVSLTTSTNRSTAGRECPIGTLPHSRSAAVALGDCSPAVNATVPQWQSCGGSARNSAIARVASAVISGNLAVLDFPSGDQIVKSAVEGAALHIHSLPEAAECVTTSTGLVENLENPGLCRLCVGEPPRLAS